MKHPGIYTNESRPPSHRSRRLSVLTSGTLAAAAMLLGACGGDGDGTGGTMQTAGAGSASTAGTTPAGGETPATDATITQDSTTAATDTTNAETTTAVVGTSTTTTTETAETPTDTAGTETAPDVEVDYAAIAASGACITDGGVDEDGFIPLYAHPDNNYTFSSTVSVSTIAAMPNTELFFDWSTLTTDFLGHDVDPLADIDTVALILWELTLEEMTEKLNADELSAQYAAAAIALYTNNEVTTGSIFDFQVAGGGELPPEELMPRLDPANYDPATHTYALMAQTGGVLGQGVKMVQAFHLDEASENTQVDITPESTSLSFDVDLSDSLVPVSLPLGETNVLVDWSDMETTALNLEWKIRSIQEVMVAKYSLTPADLEAQFLDLELIADEMYRGEVEAGDEFVLTDLVEETTGAPFNGITEDGTWVLALVCTRCSNPAPWYLTRLQPCAQ